MLKTKFFGLRNPNFKFFLPKYCIFNIPVESALRKESVQRLIFLREKYNAQIFELFLHFFRSTYQPDHQSADFKDIKWNALTTKRNWVRHNFDMKHPWKSLLGLKVAQKGEHFRETNTQRVSSQASKHPHFKNHSFRGQYICILLRWCSYARGAHILSPNKAYYWRKMLPIRMYQWNQTEEIIKPIEYEQDVLPGLEYPVQMCTQNHTIIEKS